MKRTFICSLLTALLGGCVVVPLHNSYDGYERGGQRFEEHHRDGGERYYHDGDAAWTMAGAPTP